MSSDIPGHNLRLLSSLTALYGGCWSTKYATSCFSAWHAWYCPVNSRSWLWGVRGKPVAHRED